PTHSNVFLCQHCGFLNSQPSDSRDDDNRLHPPFPRHLLTTNDSPSDVEAAQIRDVIDDLRTRISNLDTSIAVVEGLLAKFRSRRKNAVEHIHRGRAIFSIIRCLPADVLGEIFSYTVPHTPRRRATERSPWILGRSLATLWSNIDSSFPHPVLMEQLQRSKGSRLTIRLIYSDTAALGPLVDCSSRWETVDIQMGVNMLPILDRIHGKVPMLRQLKYTDSTGVGSSRAFEIAPNLSSVILNGKASLRLPWTQLSRLRQRIPKIDDLNQLGSARNIVELSLTNSISPALALARTLGLTESMLEFPHLRVLYIEDGEFLDYLVLPSLEDISISRSPSSLCRLRKLTSIDPLGKVLPILDHAVTLLEMRLMLSNTAQSPPFLPYHTFRSQCSLFVQMVESRLLSAACPNLSSPCRGTDVEWLAEKPARRRAFIDWVDEYP
ncbi:hypothetical protein B0H13DRAFT_2043533, partial [Mycena leptocephala]